MQVTSGDINVITYFVLRSTVDGTGATALTITDLDLQYTRSGIAPAAKVNATALAATGSAHGDNKAIEIDATDQPGLYRVDWPDAAFAAGAREVILTVKGTNVFTEHLAVAIDAPVDATKISGNATAADNLESACDNYSATRGLTGTALPAAAADAAGGVPISDAGGLDIDAKLAATNEVTAARMAALTDWINGGRLDLLLDAILVDTAVIGAAGAGLTDLGGMSTGMKGEVQTEANDALIANNLDHLMNTAVASNANMTTEVTDGTVLSNMMSKTSDTSTFTVAADSLEAIRDNQSTASVPTTLQSTTIASLASQTSFTLTAGSADDDAYNDRMVIVEDQTTGTQKAVGQILDYTGSGKTVTLISDPSIFTMAAGDTVTIIATPDQLDLNQTDLNTIIAKFTGSTINITNRVDGDGTITIVRGEDSVSTIGTELSVSKSGYAANAFDSGTGIFRYSQAGATAVAAGTVAVTQATDTVTAKITLTDTEATAMTAAVDSTYEVEITTTGSLISILADGKMIVRDKVS